MIYLFKVCLLVIGLVSLVTIVMVATILITGMVFRSIVKAAGHVFTLRRSAGAWLKSPVSINEGVKNMEAS